MPMKKPIRFATFLAPNIYPVYRYIANYIGEGLDCPTEMIYAFSHDQFFEVDADVSFICGLPYILFVEQAPQLIELLAAPVLVGARYDDLPIYFSDVIVTKQSRFYQFEDLRQQTWGYNEEVSQSGYGITRHHLVQMRETKGFFGHVMRVYSHQTAIKWILNGKLDGAAIDSQVLQVAFNQHPSLQEQLRIIDTFGPSPIQPIVVNSQLSDALKSDIQQILLNMQQDKVARQKLADGLIKRFVKVSDQDYDPIREMRQQAKAHDFLQIR